MYFPHTLHDLAPAALVEEAIKQGEGKLSAQGGLVVETAPFTGRAADDKYVVDGDYARSRLDWGNQLHRMGRPEAQALRAELLRVLGKAPVTYGATRWVGAHPRWRLKVRLLTDSAAQGLFFHHMLREGDGGALQEWSVIHCPRLFIPDPARFGLARPVGIVLDFEHREVMVVGTSYAGEVKKALFSVMNTLLPDHGVLPMHAGANVGAGGDVSVFFGLSGTGKTTLSTDEGRALIGDDEHGLADDGVFNFEGGCYAKTAGLNPETEPQIHAAAGRFATLLENVALPPDRVPDFSDLRLTENGRASYPLSAIPGVHPGQRAGLPQDLFFLSADAFGVMPALASLTPKQAMEYFLCGYTSKLAGTEVGIKEPRSAFSHCFGAPFMLRRPREYAELLGGLMEKHRFNVWFINTGWTAGGYGRGQRFPLKVTRQIIRAIQERRVDPKDHQVDPVLGLAVPRQVPGVEARWLLPSRDTQAERKAQEIKRLFAQQLEKVQAAF